MINYEALCYGFLFVIASLFVLAYLGMWDGPRYGGRRPPEHPPGWKNIKRSRKR